jgi:putative phage-type endonuclease
MLTEKQIAVRQTGVGSSEVAAALGLSKWTSRLELYRRKVGELPPQDETMAMRFGHAVEPFILSEYERERDVTLVRSPDTMRKGILLAHLDGWLPNQLVVNAKTARSRLGWGEPGSAEMPVDYLLQETAEMIIADVRIAHVPVLFFGSAIEVYELKLDNELAQMIMAGVDDFWSRVLQHDPPPPGTLAEINERWPISIARRVELPPNVARQWHELIATKTHLAALESDAERMEAQIKLAMGDAEVATIDGMIAATWKTPKPARVLNQTLLRAEHPELAAQYEIERHAGRRFLLKG